LTTDLDAEVQAVEVADSEWWPVLISEAVSWAHGPGDPVFGVIQASHGPPGRNEWLRMTLAHLVLVLKALTPEQRLLISVKLLDMLVVGLGDEKNPLSEAFREAQKEKERADRLERQLARAETFLAGLGELERFREVSAKNEAEIGGNR